MGYNDSRMRLPVYTNRDLLKVLSQLDDFIYVRWGYANFFELRNIYKLLMFNLLRKYAQLGCIKKFICYKLGVSLGRPTGLT